VSSFKRGHNLLTRHAWKLVEKLVEGVSFFDVIDQVAQRHPGSYEDRRPPRSPRRYGLLGGELLFLRRRILAHEVALDITAIAKVAWGRGKSSALNGVRENRVWGIFLLWEWVKVLWLLKRRPSGPQRPF